MHPVHLLHSERNDRTGVCRFTCGGVRLSGGVYSIHGQYGVVLLLPLEGEDHFSQGISDPPPLQNHTWQRVQRPKLLQNILQAIIALGN